MRRLLVLLACAALAVVPAVVGLMGNQSFSEEVAVRIPPQVVANGAPVGPHAAAKPTASATPEPSEHRLAGGAPATGDRRSSVRRHSSDDPRAAGSGDTASTSGRFATASGSTPRTDRGPGAGASGRGKVEPGDDHPAAVEPGDDANRSRRGSGSGSATPSGSASTSSGSGRSGAGSGSDDGSAHR